MRITPYGKERKEASSGKQKKVAQPIQPLHPGIGTRPEAPEEGPDREYSKGETVELLDMPKHIRGFGNAGDGRTVGRIFSVSPRALGEGGYSVEVEDGEGGASYVTGTARTMKPYDGPMPGEGTAMMKGRMGMEGEQIVTKEPGSQPSKPFGQALVEKMRGREASSKNEVKVAGFGDEPAYSYEGPGAEGPGAGEPDAPGMPEPGPTSGYSLMLTDAEVETLAWLADRGYFPTELYDAMDPAEGEPEEVDRNVERRWVFPEHAAWSLKQLEEDDPDAYLANLGDPLLGKILELEQNIV
jgi:hypothetical protein